MHEPIVRWFPELRKDPDKRKQTITIENLLTMRSGLESTSGEDYGRWVKSRNWVRYALGAPDGERSGHVDGVQHRDLAHPLGDPHEGVAQEHAPVRRRKCSRQPLGITLARWTRDPQGIYFGGNEMLMTPRQMIAIRRAVSAPRARTRPGSRPRPNGWTHPVCRAPGRAMTRSANEAGLVDFRTSTATAPVSRGASAGNTSWCSATWISSIVVTSATDISDERRNYRRQLFDLIGTKILPQVKI